MILLFTSIIGLVLYLICSYLFYISKSNAKLILLGVISIIPIVGVLRFLYGLINGILHHVHPLSNNTSLNYTSMWFSDALCVKDSELNRWLFNDIDWKAYDMLKKNLDNLNQI